MSKDKEPTCLNSSKPFLPKKSLPIQKPMCPTVDIDCQDCPKYFECPYNPFENGEFDE